MTILSSRASKSSNEKEFLLQKSEELKAALFDRTQDLVAKVSEELKLENYVKKYPFASAGTAILFGFLLSKKWLSKEEFPVDASSSLPFSPPVEKDSNQNKEKFDLLSILIAGGVDLLKKSVTPWLMQQFHSLNHEEAKRNPEQAQRA